MNVKFLTILANFLDKGKMPGELNMGYYWFKNSCETSACAAGWATTIPTLKKAGLELHISSDGGGQRGYPWYKCSSGFVALSEFFDIPGSLAHKIFNNAEYAPNYNPNRKMVAQRIREIIKEHPNATANHG